MTEDNPQRREDPGDEENMEPGELEMQLSEGQATQMNVARAILALVFCTFFTASYLTNKYVLSVLKFTFPTIFQGWQTLSGTLLLLVTWKLGLVEFNGFSRSATFSQLPGCILFIGNIYAGSKALSLLPIPFFFVLQNVSEVLAFLISAITQRKVSLVCLLLGSSSALIHSSPQFGPSGFTWASIHLFCVGTYKVFQKNTKTSLLSAMLLSTFAYSTGNTFVCECLLNISKNCLLIFLSGDLLGALEFPLLTSYRFHTGFLGSAVFSFLLMLATVKLKSSLSPEQCGVLFFLAKILASGLSFVLPSLAVVLNPEALCW
ncbi:hypothetical protein DNTS_013522 [Danionella cerebrum]|uniref:Sugar phosphate transporter domain-containing protein n=1 Tax=Danionella cerebrum TaxID=2873325 RepID=A0A553QN40_9TELE|nr:hypothetical protein DNTS_013522 [Danionella translucida]